MILNFGKYKGKSIDEIYKIDEGYIIWLSENSYNDLIKNKAKDLICLSKNGMNRIENIVYECIISRGYSDTEARMFLKQLKK